MTERFQWDEAKRLSNLDKHGLDFEDVDQLFDGRPVFAYASEFEAEARFVAVALVEGRYVAAVCTYRGDTIRIISFRRARDGEKRRYQDLYSN